MKIFAFGDSFTEGHWDLTAMDVYQKWYKFRGDNLPDLWIRHLANKLNCNCINYGYRGTGNQDIFEKVCAHSSEFDFSDIVIIGWTYMFRHRWANLDIQNSDFLMNDWSVNTRAELWYDMGRGVLNFDDYTNPKFPKYISQNTLDEICVNRTSFGYVKEIKAYEKLIENYAKSKGFKVFFWSADDRLINSDSIDERMKSKYICAEQISLDYNKDVYPFGALMSYIISKGGQTINEETNCEIPDHHFGELGHKVQGELFYEYIINNDYKYSV